MGALISFTAGPMCYFFVVDLLFIYTSVGKALCCLEPFQTFYLNKRRVYPSNASARLCAETTCLDASLLHMLHQAAMQDPELTK